MKLSNFAITAIAASAAVSASPVDMHKRLDLTTLLTDVTSLVGTVLTDVDTILADAGLNLTTVLEPILKPLDLKRREEATSLKKKDVAALEERGLDSVVGDVQKLVSDLLGDISKLTGDILAL